MNKQELIRKANDQLIGQGDMQAIEQFFTAAYLAGQLLLKQPKAK